VIAASSTSHTSLILAAIAAGKAVFCEKPMAETLEEADRSIAAAKAAGLPLQVGFYRRFARAFREAHDVIAVGGIGTPQLLRSLTRDPGLANPGALPPWTIFTQTLIHDFDALNWLNRVHCRPGSHWLRTREISRACE
jgi:myo-inositol 2-dehydrogenase/D-chiro-inositol 1-dehydrogenase